MKTGVLILAMVLALTGVQAQAKRLGGGKSLGQQSHQVSSTPAPKAPPAATPSAPTATPQGAAAANTAKPAPAPTPPAAPAPAPARPWAGMLGGLAAGLGLAWLASSLGLGAGMGQFFMVLLVGVLVLTVISLFLRRRTPASDTPYVFEGQATSEHPSAIPQYNPRNVGNDSSARPVDTDPTYQPTASIIGADLPAAASQWAIPAGFDVAGFVQAAKDNFLLLQKAWDHSDFATLRSMMTDTMLQEVSAQLSERESQAKGQLNVTEVLSLDAQLLGIEDQGGSYLASVEFSGMVREDVYAGPTPFREVWNLLKSKDGQSGWLVAGVQSLQ